MYSVIFEKFLSPEGIYETTIMISFKIIAFK